MMKKRFIAIVLTVLCSVHFNFLLAQDEEGPIFHIVCDGAIQDINLYNQEKAKPEFILSKTKLYDAKSMFEISNLSPSDISAQNRSFGIYKADSWVMDIPASKKNKVFCLKTATLLAGLQAGKYEVYTLAIPSDPEIAKLVKPGRVKVCTIIVE